MDKQILNGFKLSFGFGLGLSIFFGLVYAIGFHSAQEIIGGIFQGDYIFNGSVNFTDASVEGIIPINMTATFNSLICPSGWTNTSFSGVTGDLTTGGSGAISSSTHSSYVPSRAYDDSVVLDGTDEAMMINGDSLVSNEEYIGYNFGTSYPINKIRFNQYYSNSFYSITALDVQASNDCSSWITIYSASGLILGPDVNYYNNITFSNTQEYSCWRLLPTVNTPGGGSPDVWIIQEIEMMANITTINCVKD